MNCRGSQRNRRRSRVSERLDEERQAISRFQKRNKRHVEKINEIRQKNIARNKPASLKRYKLSKQLAIKRVAKALFYSNSKSAQLKLDKALAESSLYKHKKPTSEESTIPTNHPEDPFPEMKEMLPNVVKELMNKDPVQGKRLLQMFRLIEEKKFPFDNISFLLFEDVILWFFLTDARAMRCTVKTRTFQTVGRKLFGSMFSEFIGSPGFKYAIE